MKTVLSSLIFILIATSAHAYSGGLNIQISTSKSQWHRVQAIALNAQDDVYMFFASQGQVVGANLIQAVAVVRETHPEFTDEQAINALVEIIDQTK